MPLARVDNYYQYNDIYYYHTDQIGTPLELTNEQGEIVWQANYKAWGEIDYLSINKVEQNLRYQGQYFDQETGLHYNTFRYYDPQVGRFTTQDPIGLAGGVNLYQYVPNPLGWIDPLGLTCEMSKTSDLTPTHLITKGKGNKRDLLNGIKQNGIKESIKVVEYNGEKYIVNGHHRYFSAIKLGIKDVPIEKVSLPYAGYKTTDDFFREIIRMPGYWRYL